MNMSICFALKSKICKASAFATFGSSAPTKSRRKYVYVGALVQVSCLNLLPSGSCQKRKALFADGPPMVPVKKNQTDLIYLKRLLEITLPLEKSHDAKMK